MFDKILKEIKEEKKKIKKELSIQSPEVTFFQDFLDNYSLKSLHLISNIDTCDLIIAYLSAKSKNMDYQQIKLYVEDSADFIEESDCDVYLPIIASVENAVKELSEEKLLKTLNELSKNKNILSYFKMKKLSTSVTALVLLNQIEEYSCLGLIKLMCKDTEEVKNVLSLTLALKLIQEEQEDFNDYIGEYNLKEKDSNRMFAGILKSKYKTEDMSKSFMDIKSYAENLISKENSRRKSLNKQLINYNILETFLKNNKNRIEIFNIPKEATKISNEKIKSEFLTIIYQLNLDSYQEIQKDYERLSNNSTTKYQLLFQKYGLDFAKYRINSKNNIEDVEEIISKLLLQDFEKDDVLNIINKSNIKTIKEIINYIEKGYLSSSFAKENPTIFNQDYETVTNNIKLFQKNKFSAETIKLCENSLTVQEELLNKNIEILKEYNLIKSLKQSSNTSFLKNDNLAEIIDLVLENNLEEVLNDKLDILNYSKEDILKIKILKLLDIPIDHNNIYSILSNNLFHLNSNQINDYLNDEKEHIKEISGETKTKQEFLEELSNYESGESTYTIDDIIISKNKIKRNLNNYDNDLTPTNQFQIITSNMTLSLDECNKIINTLTKPSNKVLENKM